MARVPACGKDVPRDVRRERGGSGSPWSPGPYVGIICCSSLAPGAAQTHGAAEPALTSCHAVDAHRRAGWSAGESGDMARWPCARAHLPLPVAGGLEREEKEYPG
jgi:hypothetical protein